MTLEDPYPNRFFRVTPQAYGFLKQLTPERTIDDIWHELAARHDYDRLGPGGDDRLVGSRRFERPAP